MRHQLTQQGFAGIPRVLEHTECANLLAVLGPVEGAGRRGLLGCPTVASLARSEQLVGLVRPHLPAEPMPVRAIYFDKSPDANWLVPWHQDLTLALGERVEVDGWGPWSVKEGVAPGPAPTNMMIHKGLA